MVSKMKLATAAALTAVLAFPLISMAQDAIDQTRGNRATTDSRGTKFGEGSVGEISSTTEGVSPPEWVRRPLREDFNSVFPAEALRQGRDGRATLDCVVTIDGGVRDCRIASESPAGLGFGRAAQQLSVQFTFRPATRNGRPVESRISVPIAFVGPGTPTGSLISGVRPQDVGAQKVLRNVPWVSAPTVDQVVAAYPARARQEKKTGRATLYCTIGAEGELRACDLSTEDPAGLEFGFAAQSLVRHFKAPKTLTDGTPTKDMGVQLPFTFSQRMLDGAPGIGRPHWIKLPENADLGAAFPGKARAEGVLKSRVDMRCTVTPGGALGNCRVLAETPKGYGFGDAAVNLAPKFVVSQWSEDGLPTVGGSIVVPVGYDLKLGEAPAPKR